MTYSIEDQINFEASDNTKDTTLIEMIVKAEEQVESKIGSEEMKDYPNMLFEAQAMAFWMVNKGFHIRRLEDQVKHMFAEVEKMREIIKSLKKEEDTEIADR
tara:strand:- start:200 stop:505 length:306 start_codon:yes stop_codon:yes gene_type:complete